MEPFPTTIDSLKKAVQELWDETEPGTYVEEIKKMPEECREVIKQNGGQTRHSIADNMHVPQRW